METNADGAGGGVHGLAFDGIGGVVELAGWAHEGTDFGAGVGGGDAKHAGGGGAVGCTALAVGIDGVGSDSIGDDADSGWSICAGVGGGDAVGSGGRGAYIVSTFAYCAGVRGDFTINVVTCCRCCCTYTDHLTGRCWHVNQKKRR